MFFVFNNFDITNVCSDVPRRFFPGRRAPAIAPRDGISCSGEPLTPIWAAHWAVTQVHGTHFVQLAREGLSPHQSEAEDQARPEIEDRGKYNRYI